MLRRPRSTVRRHRADLVRTCPPAPWTCPVIFRTTYLGRYPVSGAAQRIDLVLLVEHGALPAGMAPLLLSGHSTGQELALPAVPSAGTAHCRACTGTRTGSSNHRRIVNRCRIRITRPPRASRIQSRALASRPCPSPVRIRIFQRLAVEAARAEEPPLRPSDRGSMAGQATLAPRHAASAGPRAIQHRARPRCAHDLGRRTAGSPAMA